MYYKITDQSSEVYQKLHKLRSAELQMEKENKKAIEAKTGMTWDVYLGDPKQQHFRRVCQFYGFKFHQSEKVDTKIWKKDKKHPGIWVPNTRTKAGREMQQFLSNGLKASPYYEVFEILRLQSLGRFTFPFVEICDGVIILYLGDNHRPKDLSVIEITSVEFDSIREQELVKNA